MNLYKIFLDCINLLCITLILFLGLFSFYELISSDESIQFCYISEEVGSSKNLMGFRSWRADLKISSIKDIDEGILIAEKLKCPLLKK